MQRPRLVTSPAVPAATALLALLVAGPGLFAELARADVDCGGGAQCPDDNTCCPTGSGGYSCCPAPDATCCADYVHCCPSDHPVCDLSTGSCGSADGVEGGIAQDERVPWLTKTKAKLIIGGV